MTSKQFRAKATKLLNRLAKEQGVQAAQAAASRASKTIDSVLRDAVRPSKRK